MLPRGGMLNVCENWIAQDNVNVQSGVLSPNLNRAEGKLRISRCSARKEGQQSAAQTHSHTHLRIHTAKACARMHER